LEIESEATKLKIERFTLSFLHFTL
jgi:hypothetical protein